MVQYITDIFVYIPLDGMYKRVGCNLNKHTMIHFRHKIDYWKKKKNKPLRIGESNVTKDDWNTILSILERFKKPIGFNRISKLYNKISEEKFKKHFLNYLNPETNIEAIKEHSNYLSYLYDQEKKRQENIDSKAKQIITNVSLIFTIIAFSSSIILNKDNYINFITDYSLIIVSISLLFSITSLVIAVLVLDFRRYNRPKQEIVYNEKNYIETQFNKQKVTDFTACLSLNINTNRKKSSRLIFANWSFIISIFFVGLFTFSNLLAIQMRNKTNSKPKIEQVKIIDTIDVNVINCDSVMKKEKK